MVIGTRRSGIIRFKGQLLDNVQYKIEYSNLQVQVQSKGKRKDNQNTQQQNKKRIPRTCWPPTDDEPLRYEFGAPPFLNFLWISHSIKGRHHGESLFWQRIPTATSIINAILPIISAEPALFGVYADDLFSRWRALRGFRNTLKRRPRVATVAFDGRYMG